MQMDTVLQPRRYFTVELIDVRLQYRLSYVLISFLRLINARLIQMFGVSELRFYPFAQRGNILGSIGEACRKIIESGTGSWMSPKMLHEGETP